MELSTLEKHYEENFSKLVKKMSFRAGTQWAGEDVVQMAYERAIRYRHSCDPERIGQWFNTILNNALRDYRNAENGYTSLDDVTEEAETADCPHYPERIMREIYELIGTKSDVQREVLLMHFKQDFSAIDVSRMTSYSYAQCHQIIQRFRNELKEIYK